MSADAHPTTSGSSADHGSPDRCPLVDYDFGTPSPELHRTLADAREACPAGWSDLYGGFWLLTTFDEVQGAARDFEQFTTTRGIMIPPTGASMPVIPAELDPPDHTPFRKLTLPYFTARAVKEVEPELRDIVRRTIAGFSGTGRADLVRDVAEVVPPLAIGLILGLDAEQWPEIRRLAGAFMSSAKTDIGAKMQAAQELEAWVEERIRVRRENPTDDTLSKLVNAQIDGEDIPAVTALGMIQLMVMAGHETTIHGIGSLMFRVLAEPGMKERLLDDPALMRSAVHESLRIDPPIMHMARTAVEDRNHSGATMRSGDKVMLNFGAANRDPDKFPEPGRFDIDRDSGPHLGFGTGRHRCIGEHLAVTEMLVVLEEILTTLPDVRIVGETDIEKVPWRGGSNTLGPATLPVEFTPVQA